MTRPKTLTHATQERMRQETRRQEDIRSDHLSKLKADSLINTFQQSDERITAKRHLRRLAQEEHEREIQKGILITAEEKRQKEAQQEAEEQLANQLETLRLEKMRDEKMRQQIRETSYELRELEEKLRAAYMNKERAAQIAEKMAERHDDETKDRELFAMMQEEENKSQENMIKKQRARDQAAIEYQEQLERQLEEQEHKKQMEYEEFLKDKLLIDEAVRKIHEEDQSDQERRLEKQKATRAYIAEFKQKRDQWKAEELKRQQAENNKILEFAAMQTNREADRMQAARDREEQLNNLQTRLANKIRAEKEARSEMERLRQELYLEEQEQTAREMERAEIEKKIRQRLELRQAHMEQMYYKTARNEAEQQEEEVFRQQMLAKFAHDDEVELLNAAVRRQKQLEHRRAVENLIEERRATFDLQRAAEIQEHQEKINRESIRAQIIEEERQRILQEHADKLVGYMPKGVFNTFAEVQKLGNPALEQSYSRREVKEDDEDDSTLQ